VAELQQYCMTLWLSSDPELQFEAHHRD